MGKQNKIVINTSASFDVEVCGFCNVCGSELSLFDVVYDGNTVSFFVEICKNCVEHLASELKDSNSG